jgi:tetratricopeptide (TPR) repeat protein
MEMGLAASLTLDEIVARLRAVDADGERRRLLAAALAEHDPEPLLLHLRAEAERYRQVDTQASLRLAEAVVGGAELAGSPGHQALGLMAKADALWLLGRYAAAVEHYETARRRFADLGDEVGWARTHIGWVIACHYLGRGAAALAALPPAHAILVRRQEWLRAAAMDMNAGYVCWRLGRYAEALERYERAQQTFATLGPDQELKVAWTKGNKAIVLTLLGDFDAALALWQEARAVEERHGDTISVLRADQFIADIYAAQGDYTRALRLYGETMAALEAAGLGADAAWVALSMADCYTSLNRPAEALALAQEATDRFEQCGSPTEAATARAAAAAAWLRIGDPAPARALLDQAGATFAQTDQREALATVQFLRAGLALLEDDRAAALDMAAQAEALFADQGLVARRTQAALLRARALAGAGNGAAAEAVARAALAAIERHGLGWLAHAAHHLLATLARDRGEPARALAAYDAALAGIERVQGRLAVELRGTFLDDKLQVYHDAIDCALAVDRPALAFAYLERAKSRALVDYLATNPGVHLRVTDPADRALADELARLRAEHDWFYRRLYGAGLARRADGPFDGDPAAGAEALTAAIAERERQIARLVERLALRQAPDQARRDGLTERSEAGPPALDAGTVLIEYYLGEGGGAAFVVAGGDLALVPLGASAGDVRRLVHLWQLNVDATARALAAGEPLAVLARNARGILAALHRALLAPLAGRLVGCARAIVVPYGPAHAVPFHALFDGQRYWLEQVEVAVCPSSSLLRLLRQCPRRRAGGVLVLACTDDGRLPHVLDEAAVIARLLPGAEVLQEAAATRAALAERAGRHRIIHLAAHGEARLDNPAFAHLRLADGQLTTVDVFNLDLAGALVVLSACETGRSVVAGGDELIGLSRGFLFAGATALVQSLWRVEDRDTARLMAGFYAALRAGAAPAAALRAAQTGLLAERGAASHPYCWAAFQVVGDGGPA